MFSLNILEFMHLWIDFKEYWDLKVKIVLKIEGSFMIAT